ncbi:retrovirus-related pol polyprotein from transposon TNT 1-94 [Tanacetum coccineum]
MTHHSSTRSRSSTINFKADHVDAYDSDCDDEATTNAIFMENLSPVDFLNDDMVKPHYDSDILSEVPYYDNYHDSDMLNSNIQELGYIENIVSNNESYDELTSNNNVISYIDYMLTIGNDEDDYVPPLVQKNDMMLSVIEQMKSQVEKYNMLKMDVLKKKHTAVHQDYLNVAKENVSTLHELLEEAREFKTLDEHIGHASKFAKRIQELLVYVSTSCPFTQSGNEKWAPTTCHRKNNKPYVDASRMKQTIEIITQKHAVKQNIQKTDNTMLPSIGRVSSINASGSKPKSNTKNDRIPQPSSRSKKNKVEAHHRKFKSSANKNNHVLDCNANVKNVALSKNSDTICLSCNECLFSANHDACVIVEIVLWYLDSGRSKHMTGHRDKLINFVSKFIRTVHFGNDHFAAIMGYGDLKIGNILISRVYYVEGLGHNLFLVGQFCDSDLELAFRKHTCFVGNLEGVNILSGSRGSNLYTISMANMMKSSPICFVKELPKLKYTKGHLCSACQMGKSKEESHPHKRGPSINEKLQMLHTDLCEAMQVESINKKRYILVIVDDYSRFTQVKFLRTKDEALEIIIKFLKQAQVSLNDTVRYLRTNNGTEFINQTLRNFTKEVGITHNTSTARTPQQNGVVERRNRTLVEAVRTMLSFYKSLLFLWAEAVANACYTQNRSLIHTRYNKTSYELLRDRKLELKYLYVYGALCYLTKDFEDLGKLQPKVDIGIFIGPKLHGLTSGHITSTSSSSSSIDKDAPSPSNSPNIETTNSLINSTNLKPHEEVAEFDSDTSKAEPKNYKEAMEESCWIEAMQEEIYEFDRLEVWELVPRPDKAMIISLQ